MFEFTKLGVVVFVVGTVYLMTVGQRLIPERVLPVETVLEGYDLEPYLAEVVVDETSSFVGRTVSDTMDGTELDADVVSLVRGEGTFLEPMAGNTVRPGDVLVVRADIPTLRKLMASRGLSFCSADVTEASLAPHQEGETIVELVVPSWSSLTGETLESATFRQTYDANVLAVRRGSELLHEWMDRTPLRRGTRSSPRRAKRAPIASRRTGISSSRPCPTTPITGNRRSPSRSPSSAASSVWPRLGSSTSSRRRSRASSR